MAPWGAFFSIESYHLGHRSDRGQGQIVPNFSLPKLTIADDSGWLSLEKGEWAKTKVTQTTAGVPKEG